MVIFIAAVLMIVDQGNPFFGGRDVSPESEREDEEKRIEACLHCTLGDT